MSIDKLQALRESIDDKVALGKPIPANKEVKTYDPKKPFTVVDKDQHYIVKECAKCHKPYIVNRNNFTYTGDALQAASKDITCNYCKK